MDDGLEFQFGSDDEHEDVDEEVDNIYHTTVAAKESIRDDDTRVTKRINRGSTVAFYYKCKFSSCGCKR